MNRRQKHKAVDKWLRGMSGEKTARLTAREKRYVENVWPREVARTLRGMIDSLVIDLAAAARSIRETVKKLAEDRKIDA